MGEVNGYETCGCVGALMGQGGRDLQDALSADKVDMEGGAEGVSAIRHAGNFGSALFQQRVVHGHHQRLLLVEVAEDAPADGAEESAGIEAHL